MSVVAEKTITKSSVKYDRKRMEKAVSSKQVSIQKGLTRDQKRSLIMSHA